MCCVDSAISVLNVYRPSAERAKDDDQKTRTMSKGKRNLTLDNEVVENRQAEREKSWGGGKGREVDAD